MSKLPYSMIPADAIAAVSGWFRLSSDGNGAAGLYLKMRHVRTLDGKQHSASDRHGHYVERTSKRRERGDTRQKGPTQKKVEVAVHHVWHKDPVFQRIFEGVEPPRQKAARLLGPDERPQDDVERVFTVVPGNIFNFFSIGVAGINRLAATMGLGARATTYESPGSSAGPGGHPAIGHRAWGG